MEEIHARRRLRLRQIIEERFDGCQRTMARAAGRPPSYSSHFAGIFHGRRNLGDRGARRIEQALGLPDGWMDRKPPLAAAPIEEPYKARMGHPPKVHIRTVAKLLAKGYTQRKIAKRLGVHWGTVGEVVKRDRERGAPEIKAAFGLPDGWLGRLPPRSRVPKRRHKPRISKPQRVHMHVVNMAEIHARRRLRLRQLIEERFDGNQSLMARTTGYKGTNVSTLLNPAHPFGERAAWKLEAALGLPEGSIASRWP